MEQILDLYNQQNKEVIIIIDDENSLMGDLIKDVFINERRKVPNFLIFMVFKF